jgi:thiopurine S-methyltransferase
VELASWSELWREGRIPFHQAQVSEFLLTYADRVWGGEPLRRVLVPLCGKSLDLVYLADRAEAVVGVEYVEPAVQAFFLERGLTAEVDAGPPVRYAADRYTLFAADFFAVTADHLGVVDAVFDRAALVALDPPTRSRYADHLRSLLPSDARMLLVTLDYDQDLLPGPPYAVSAQEVDRLYSEGFTVEHLQTRDALTAAFREQGLGELTTSAYALTRR